MSAQLSPRGFRRARCAGCGLTCEGCVCRLYTPLGSNLALSVVMSRSEARSASNSARLLRLWLPGVAIVVRGEPGDDGAPEHLTERPGTAVLFPGESGRPLPEGITHLIVPDGTWSQARRIERRWFAARGLPRVSLDGPWPSVYGLRRGARGLCTFEACALALGLLDDRVLAAALLGRFSEWARRARQLKAGGGHPPSALACAPPPEHPALRLLAALPPGTADAARASLGAGPP